MPVRPAVFRGLAAALLIGTALSAAACSSTTAASAPKAKASPSPSGMSDDMMMDMAGIPKVPAPAEAAPQGTGLAGSDNGYVYLPAEQSLPANTPADFDFHITGPDDHALTRYQPYESKLVVFYLIRSDLTGYRILDPVMHEDGTWTVAMPALPPGSYRTYVTFAAPDSSQGTPLLYALSKALTVQGKATDTALPAAASSTSVDGYQLTLSGKHLTVNSATSLSLDVTKDGKPVSYFQRYLDGYAHLVAFHAGDGAFAHILSTGRDGGPGASGPLTAQTQFPERGAWRVFVQFEIGDTMHTTAFTVNVT